MNPHRVTKDFERALCEYTCAPYAVAVNSCTMALLLAVAWNIRDQKEAWSPTPTMPGEGTYSQTFIGRNPPRRDDGRGWISRRVYPGIEIPKRTYVSVPMSIIHAGGRPTFRDEAWRGAYQLKPLPVWDSARHFTSELFDRVAREHHEEQMGSGFVCVSFHWSKTLGIQQGGAILHDNPDADWWLRRARFDGRTEGVPPKDDHFDMIGWHCYMSPEVAAEGLVRLAFLPKHNDPLPNDDYPDLSTMDVFK